MLIGIAAALFACFGYGTASVLQGYGARQSSTEVGMAADHGPSLKSTVAAALLQLSSPAWPSISSDSRAAWYRPD